jgi:arsenate reductase
MGNFNRNITIKVSMFYPRKTIEQLTLEFDRIPAERRHALQKLTSFVEGAPSPSLVFICTHNSRRSHIAQVWAATAAAWYNIPGVKAYSGGTEATEFNPRAINALKEIGFQIEQKTPAPNPRYSVRYSTGHPAFEVYSKKYDAPENPASNFAAVMTCTHADENCPVVTGASSRISLPYDDPKDFDGTTQEAAKYLERSREIGREILYAFSQIKSRC